MGIRRALERNATGSAQQADGKTNSAPRQVQEQKLDFRVEPISP